MTSGGHDNVYYWVVVIFGKGPPDRRDPGMFMDGVSQLNPYDIQPGSGGPAAAAAIHRACVPQRCAPTLKGS